MKYICLLLLLSGCVSAGVKVNSATLASLEKGKTTYAQVVEALGAPTQVVSLDNGVKEAVYSYISGQPRPESFIPIAGAFVGGADTENSTVVLTFDKGEILRSCSKSEGSVGTGTGFEAYSQARNYSQPAKN